VNVLPTQALMVNHLEFMPEHSIDIGSLEQLVVISMDNLQRGQKHGKEDTTESTSEPSTPNMKNKHRSNKRGSENITFTSKESHVFRTLSVELQYTRDNVSISKGCCTYTTSNILAVSDFLADNVHLVDNYGDILKTSYIHQPRGITYNRMDNTILVASSASNHVTVLDADSLKVKHSIQLAQFSELRALEVSSDCTRICTTGPVTKYSNAHKLGVFLINGRMISMWGTYGKHKKKLPLMPSIYSDSSDIVWVRGSNTSVLGFNHCGHLLHTVSTPNGPYGITEYNGLLIIAIDSGQILATNISTNKQQVLIQYTPEEMRTMNFTRYIASQSCIQGDKLAVMYRNGVKVYTLSYKKRSRSLDLDWL